MQWPSSAPRLHPAVTLFPLMEKDELVELRKDILANGLQQPLLVTAVGELIDGRNRWLACRDTNIELPQKVLPGNPYGYIIRHNLKKFNYNRSQRIMLGARLFELPVPAPWQRPRHVDIAEWFDIAISPLQRGRRILKQAIPALLSLAEEGAVPITTLERVAGLSVADQRAYVTMVRRGDDPITIAPTAPDYHQDRKPGLRPASPSAIPVRDKPPMPSVTLRTVASTLAAVGQQLRRCGDIDPSIPHDELVAWTKEVQQGVASLNRLRKLVQARVATLETETPDGQ